MCETDVLQFVYVRNRWFTCVYTRCCVYCACTYLHTLGAVPLHLCVFAHTRCCGTVPIHIYPVQYYCTSLYLHTFGAVISCLSVFAYTRCCAIAPLCIYIHLVLYYCASLHLRTLAHGAYAPCAHARTHTYWLHGTNTQAHMLVAWCVCTMCKCTQMWRATTAQHLGCAHAYIPCAQAHEHILVLIMRDTKGSHVCRYGEPQWDRYVHTNIYCLCRRQKRQSFTVARHIYIHLSTRTHTGPHHARQKRPFLSRQKRAFFVAHDDCLVIHWGSPYLHTLMHTCSHLRTPACSQVSTHTHVLASSLTCATKQAAPAPDAAADKKADAPTDAPAPKPRKKVLLCHIFFFSMCACAGNIENEIKNAFLTDGKTK